MQAPLARAAARASSSTFRGARGLSKCGAIPLANGRLRWLAGHTSSNGANGSCESAGYAHDAIIVLAGGQTTERPSGLPVHVERRLDLCADLLRLQQNERCHILCSGGGTPHKPPTLTHNGYCLHEGTACAEYLMQEGVPAARLLKEASSYDTVGNGFFAAAIHALPAGWQSLAIVTSEFHMPRSRSIFDAVFQLAAASSGRRFDLEYFSVSDDGVFPQDVLEARIARERESCLRFEADMAAIDSFAAFHRWLHSSHLCYSVSRQHEWGHVAPMSDKALASY